ncbi:ATP synthase subunit I [bacterium]|nr:ATP synthase subunit I [bacterium]MBU0900070.1 ATP synthase subunit I [bacterium]MBU1153958.1 ATP synthase subunit I [bacterium]MBU1782007.1 ATP synthase subunit I [bacterium]
MEEFHLTKRKIVITSLNLMIVGIIVSLFLKRWDSALGFLIGTSLSILNFQILAKSITKFFNFKFKRERVSLRTRLFLSIMYMARYLLIFLVLFVTFKRQDINFYTCLASLFFVKFSIFWNYSLMKLKW